MNVHLSAQQYKILIGYANGQTYEEIGRSLGITKSGVNYHVRRIQRTLGARNMANAVLKACQIGLIKL
ncbi:MAG: helix-turn-helix transcriptional regulator [Bryobacteraceae bacterium]